MYRDDPYRNAFNKIAKLHFYLVLFCFSTNIWHFTRYEESQLHDSIYQLYVKLLSADKSTVISEYNFSPTEDRSTYSHTWKEVSYWVIWLDWRAGMSTFRCMSLQVSHVFAGYGPGVRYVQFLHRLKNMFMTAFYATLFTDSSVTVRPIKTSSQPECYQKVHWRLDSFAWDMQHYEGCNHQLQKENFI